MVGRKIFDIFVLLFNRSDLGFTRCFPLQDTINGSKKGENDDEVAGVGPTAGCSYFRGCRLELTSRS